MKKIFTLAVLLLSFAYGNAQSPQKMSFQAVIRNSSNSLVSNLPIGLRVSILQGAPTGTIVYSETQTANTSVNGLVTIQIGGGNVIQGNFSTIEWANGPYFIQTETDVNGGTNYTITSTTQLLSVPYALYAQTSGSSIPGPQGPAGAAGPQGIAGTNGTNGLSAYEIAVQNGYTGTESQWLSTAIVGPQGPIGSQGPQGIAGTNGTNGIDGAQGTQGIQGPAGPQGLAGATGAQGPAGQNGLSAYEIAVQNGYNGTESQWLSTAIVGPQGPQGIAGANGIDGATGPQGPQGIQGLTGAVGPQGIQGPQGIAGTNGTNGVDGAQGPAGQNGINGQDGLSAYQIWLNAGNTGTETQFLSSLQGAIGPQGTAGTNGFNGATGPQGPAGANGINGINGTNGTNGLSAYQVWLNLGNVGTEADYISSLTGPQGIQGPAGANGQDGNNGLNGKNTLVNTTTEPAGANCANGGTKIEVGLDTNNNGVLESSEVDSSLTKYVCNGINGTTVTNGTPSLPILFPSDYVNSTNYNYGDMIYDAQNGKVKVAVPTSNGSQKFFTNNDISCNSSLLGQGPYSITFQTINTLIFSASSYSNIMYASCNDCSAFQAGRIKLYEVPMSGGIYDDGIQISTTSLLLPSKKYRIEFDIAYSNSGSCGYFVLGSLPTINSSLFTNFYFWKTNESGIKSAVTEFPKLTLLGGLSLSSPPVFGWINLN